MKNCLIILFISTLACTSTRKMAEQSDHNTYQYAVELAHRFIITDGHVDLPYRLKVKNFRLEREYMGIPIQTSEGDFDYERAKQGGLDAPFMSIFIPSSYQKDPQSAHELADSLIDMMHGIIDALPDNFARGESPEMIEANFEKGLISLPMGMENGAPILTLQDVKYFYDKGIRYITLTHGKDNQICDSSYDTTRTWGGLSPYGYEVVAEMNRIGMIVDVSHISDSTFYQVMKFAKAPVLATHSSCRAFTPGWQRNMSDDMIVELGRKGGVIQINFGTDFLDAEITKARTANRLELDSLLTQAGLKADDTLAKPIIDQFRIDHPNLYSDVQRVADHIDHVVKLAGIDHVGIGSDFDGVGDSLPTGLKDVSMYPNLIYELLKRDYSEEDIEKICYKNVWRVWHAVNAIASSK
ncbi:MAG: dipeptidase [Saprospiraceae bacterium]|nr:dipeptidase [Candidatus Opimibacter iunctus]